MSINSKMDVFKNWYIHPVETSAAMRVSKLQSREPTHINVKTQSWASEYKLWGKEARKEATTMRVKQVGTSAGTCDPEEHRLVLPAVLPATRVRMIKIVDFLGGPWLRIHLPMQGKWVWSLVRKDATCHGAARPVRHSSWGLPTAEPVLHSKGSHN